MAEYAHYYGGPPAADMPWPLVHALLGRVSRFEARAKLTLLDAVAAAIGSAFGGDTAGALRVERDRIIRRAYPLKDVPPVFFRNLFDTREREAPNA